jgi:S-DNA-T family DNA segregation ATPase FtsK/SpoIIIE
MRRSRSTQRDTCACDALLAPSPFTLEAIEHELAGESDPDEDEAQLALYRALLRAGRGVDATPRLLRFAPELEQRTLSGPRADELYARKVLPILRSLEDWERGAIEPRPPLRALICGACPLRAPCAERWPEPLPARDHPTGGARFPRPAPDGTATDAAARVVFFDGDDDVAGQREAASLEASIAKAYRERGVSVSFPEAPRIGPRWIELDVSTRARSVRELDRAVDDVVHVLLYKPGITVHFRKDGARRTFTVERAEPRVVKLASLIARERDYLSARAGRFVLGEGVGGAVVRGDLSDPSCAHVLIGGATGSGKTQLLRSLAASLVHFHGPDALQLVLIDPKRVGLLRFAQTVSAHVRRPVVSEPDEALALLDDLSGEMDERYARLESAGVEDVDELNREVSLRERLPRIVVIIDEFQALLGEGRGGGPFVEQISALGARARAAGIHLVLSTQRPDKKTLPGKLKDNLAGRVALRVADAVASRIILDQSGAECLLGRGDLLASLDGERVLRAQAALL